MKDVKNYRNGIYFSRRGVCPRMNNTTESVSPMGNKEPLFGFSEFLAIIEGEAVSVPEGMAVNTVTDYAVYVTEPYTALFLKFLMSREDRKNLDEFKPLIIVGQRGKKTGDPFEGHVLVEVEDMDRSYWRFIDHVRGQIDIPVIAVTGTCGKTTTKDMTAFILEEKYPVVSTSRSCNAFQKNLAHLLDVTKETGAAVFETPVGGPGLLTTHCRYFKPTIGVITNIGVDHLDRCKTVEEYIKAKGEMLEGLRNEGTLILNADDENTKKIPLDAYRGRVLRFGIHSDADYRAKNVRYAPGGMAFSLVRKGLSYPAFVPGYGEHQVSNALAAVAAANQAGCKIKDALRRLPGFENLTGHMEVFRGLRGATVVNDTWSSNPTSIEAALKTFDELAKNKRKIVVLGSVSLLGDAAAAIHRQIGETASSHRPDLLLAYGEHSGEIVSAPGFKEAYAFADANEAAEKLLPLFDNKTAVLVKASMYDKDSADFIKSLG